MIFLVVIVSIYAEPPAERLAGAKLDPALLARVKIILFSDGSSGAARVPGGNTASSSILGEVTLSDPVPIPLLSNFDLPPTFERRS